MSVLILVVVVALLIWVAWTHDRYTDPTIQDREIDQTARNDRERAQQIAAYRAEAEFWGRRATEAASAETRSVAATLAATHNRRADDLEH